MFRVCEDEFKANVCVTTDLDNWKIHLVCVACCFLIFIHQRFELCEMFLVLCI